MNKLLLILTSLILFLIIIFIFIFVFVKEDEKKISNISDTKLDNNIDVINTIHNNNKTKEAYKPKVKNNNKNKNNYNIITDNNKFNVVGYLYLNYNVVTKANIYFKKINSRNHSDKIVLNVNENGRFYGNIESNDYIIGIDIFSVNSNKITYTYPNYMTKEINDNINVIDINIINYKLIAKFILPSNYNQRLDNIYYSYFPIELVNNYLIHFTDNKLTNIKTNPIDVTLDGLLEGKRYKLIAKIDLCPEETLEFEIHNGLPDNNLVINLNKNSNVILKATKNKYGRDIVYNLYIEKGINSNNIGTMIWYKNRELQYNIYVNIKGLCTIRGTSLSGIKNFMVDVNVQEGRQKEFYIF